MVRRISKRADFAPRTERELGTESELARMSDGVVKFRLAPKGKRKGHLTGQEIVPANKTAEDDPATLIVKTTSVPALNIRPYEPFIRSLGPHACELLDHCL